MKWNSWNHKDKYKKTKPKPSTRMETVNKILSKETVCKPVNYNSKYIKCNSNTLN